MNPFRVGRWAQSGGKTNGQLDPGPGPVDRVVVQLDDGVDMILYDGGRAPNPRRVRIYLAEINPVQRVPALALDDGSVIAESIAICRYFEALHPEPPLFGVGARAIAEVEMWNRRLELNLLFPIAHVFRNTHPAMRELEVPQVPAWAEANKPRIMAFLDILDRALKDRTFAAGDRYTVADITGLVAVDFLKPARLTVPEACGNVRRWHAAVSARPSASA